jgi:hypothetical protein
MRAATRAALLGALLLSLTACTPEGYPSDRFELVVVCLTILLIIATITRAIIACARRRR